jgi:cytochrome c peroxidase
MKAPLSPCHSFLCLAQILFLFSSGPCVHAQEGKNPLAKPQKDRPDTLEELKNNPDYKHAPVMEKPGAPLHDRPFKPHHESSEKTAWEWHKNGMHFEAVKRGNQDRPDLRRLVGLLSPARNADNAATSAFEEVPPADVGATLTIFRPTNLDSFINTGSNEAERLTALRAAIALGKAFFWDPAFSSDGKVSCASCHYAAGTDHRTLGVVSLPANFGIRIPWPDPSSPEQYQPYRLSVRDLRGISPELDGSPVEGVFDPASIAGFRMREVIGSLGVTHRIFTGLDGANRETSVPMPARSSTPPLPAKPELEKRLQTVLAAVNAIETSHRQVTPRNAGTVINAVFNTRNFHDSRASMVFNGHTGWGQHTDSLINRSLHIWRAADQVEKVFTWSPARLNPQTLQPLLDPQGRPQPNPHYLANASLASQAVEPILSDVEMSSRGRLFHHIARRTLGRTILAKQVISKDDSSLGAFEREESRPNYATLIRTAFRKEWWDETITVKLLKGSSVTTNGTHLNHDEMTAAELVDHNLMEANFGLFWGLALQLYQSTLISDDSRFDQEQRHVSSSARAAALNGRADVGAPSLQQMQPLTEQELRGWHLFQRHGCAECHSGAAFSGGSISELGTLLPWHELAKGDRIAAASAYELPADVDAPLALVEDEPLLGQVICPVESPFGIECLTVSGRMLAIYDAGNYVLGASRFIRPPSWPSAPAISGVNAQWAYHYPAMQTALWEDSGLGNKFVPAEVTTEATKSLSQLALHRFGQHLLAGETQNRIDTLLRMLQLGTQVASEDDTSHFDPKNRKLLSGHEQQVEQLILEQALAPQRQSTLMLGQRLSVILDVAPAQMNDLDHKVADLISTVTETETLLKNEMRDALNYTQRSVTLQDVTRQEQASSMKALASQTPELITERALMPFGDGLHFIVTPATPPPDHSLARRWMQELTPFLADAERRHQTAKDQGDNALAAHWQKQIDSLRSLQGQTERVSDAAAFRAPTLRNIELTGPYMHNGSLLTLEAVIDFYSQGGHFGPRIKATADEFRTGDLHPEMEPIPMSQEDKAALVAFLKTLTDERVKNQKPPFDHPSLDIPSGPAKKASLIRLPATGKNGLPERQHLRTFSEVLSGDHGLPSGSSY